MPTPSAISPLQPRKATAQGQRLRLCTGSTGSLRKVDFCGTERAPMLPSSAPGSLPPALSASDVFLSGLGWGEVTLALEGRSYAASRSVPLWTRDLARGH